MMVKSIIFICAIQLIMALPTPKEIRINEIFSTEDCVYNLCKNSKTYNEHQTKKIVKDSKYENYLQLFGNVVDKPATNITLETRFGGVIDAKSNMCSTKRITMFPKKGFTIDNHEKNIVNIPGYRQTVTFESCYDGEECYVGKEYLPIGVSSSCETQFIVVRLVVVNEDDSLGLEQFSIPSGCSCMYSNAVRKR
ncbi:uncharacterized protein [Onthophagus taurus]|uniref:uncharacterized protein isoform X1 n=1 Tax=Onthophagus taurus TaxID=166361 RepID=UPI0039BE5303